jgi:chromosome segregation ATPase
LLQPTVQQIRSSNPSLSDILPLPNLTSLLRKRINDLAFLSTLRSKLSTDLAHAKQRTETLESEILSYKGKIVPALESKLAQLETERTKLQTDLQSSNAKHAAETARLEADLAMIAEETGRLAQSVDELESAKADLTEKLDEKTAEVRDTTAKADTEGARAREREGWVERLEGEVRGLRKALKEAEARTPDADGEQMERTPIADGKLDKVVGFDAALVSEPGTSRMTTEEMEARLVYLSEMLQLADAKLYKCNNRLRELGASDL